MPPLVIWKADESGIVTADHVAHYARSAGPGLVIVEATTIAPEGRLAATQLGIWSDEHVAGLASLARTIHEGGALAGIQIHHAGANTNLKRTYGLRPRVPSIVDSSPEGASELSANEIDAIVAGFAAGTARALRAGFDVVELHGAHGYLISQFVSPATNVRTDAWGGSAERRRALLVAAVAAARGEIAKADRRETAALTVRLGVAAGPPRTLPVDDGLAAAAAAVEAGVDFLDVSNAGPLEAELAEEIRRRAGDVVGSSAAQTLSPTLLLAALVRRTVNVPVVGVNGIMTPEIAEYVLEHQVADLAAVGRGMLADPGWARKALTGADEAIERCRECEPRCYWFGDPPKCPARRRLARRGEQPAVD